MSREAPVALITGAAKRVGRAIALELASAGYDLAIHYWRSEQEAAGLARQLEAGGRRACLIQGDLREAPTPRQLVTTCVENLGRLDLLVNNASVFEPMRLADFDAQAWDRALRVNLTAVTSLCHHAAEPLRASGRGCIVNLADLAADRPFPGYLAYSCSKAALVALTRALAVELAPAVRVNAVSPGIAVFPDHYDQATRQRLTAQVPLQRAGTPEDVARTVRFLAGAPYVTGQVIRVDGGRSVRW